jgi:hypothetical protein
MINYIVYSLLEDFNTFISGDFNKEINECEYSKYLHPPIEIKTYPEV